MSPRSKSIPLLIVVLLLSLSDCNENSTSPPLGNIVLSDITGKVNNWTMGDTLRAIASRLLNPYGRGDTLFVFGSSSIGNNGSFSLSLLAPPPEILKRFTNGISLSDTNVKYVGFSGLGVLFPSGMFLGKVLDNSNKPYPYDYAVGDYYASFEYVDRDADMIGTAKYWSGPAVTDSTMIQYSIHYKKGWNRIVDNVVSSGTHLTTHQRTIENVNEGTWFLDN
jgi:hypothetical protein